MIFMALKTFKLIFFIILTMIIKDMSPVYSSPQAFHTRRKCFVITSDTFATFLPHL